jgi:hypothetical protein
LCVDHPDDIGRVIGLVGLALVIKGCLTIVTFGIKLPGMLGIISNADDELESSSRLWLLERVLAESSDWQWSGSNSHIQICRSLMSVRIPIVSSLGYMPW